MSHINKKREARLYRLSCVTLIMTITISALVIAMGAPIWFALPYIAVCICAIPTVTNSMEDYDHE